MSIYKVIQQEGEIKMKEPSLQNKTCVASVAAVAGLSMAGLGLVSDGVVKADATSATDTINVTVQPSCTFNSVTDKTYVGSAANGTEVNNFNDSGVHEFNLFCNNNSGYTVTATPYDLEATGIDDVISYTDNYTHTGVNSMWTAAISSETEGVTVASPVPVGGGTIISSGSSTTASGTTFTATYSAYVGSATPAGTYQGRITYTLAASGSSNSGNGDNTEPESSTPEETPNSTPAETPDSAPEKTPDSTPAETSSSTPLAVKPINNYTTYNTYSTSNVYNTTNYSSSENGTASTQATANGSADDATTIAVNKNENDSEASDGYEQPLGVVTSTSSSNKDSGIDWAPIVATGAALIVAGAVAIAMARNEKEQE